MADTESRFWSRVQMLGDCWVWQGAPGSHGYGEFWVSGRSQLAHVYAYTVTMGRPAAGMVVDHSCHNKLCVNPTHLKQVTYKQNAENISGLRSTNTSGFQGVSWCKSTGRWRAKVVHHGKQIHVGYFSTPVEAGEAARAKRNELFINNSLDRV